MSPVEVALLLLAIVRRHRRSLRLSLDAAYPEEDWGFTAQQTVPAPREELLALVEAELVRCALRVKELADLAD